MYKLCKVVCERAEEKKFSIYVHVYILVLGGRLLIILTSFVILFQIYLNLIIYNTLSNIKIQEMKDEKQNKTD